MTMVNPNSKSERLSDLSGSHLRWKCRRGTLELDTVLHHCLEHVYPSLTKAEQETFSECLNTPDPTLWAWLVGDEIPENKELLRCIRQIQKNSMEGYLS